MFDSNPGRVKNINMTNILRSVPIHLAEVSSHGSYPQEVQLLKTGSFTDPRYGRFEITRTMLTEMVGNFYNGVRGVTPAIDFEHKSEGKAAAWIKDLFIKEEGGEHQLWAKPDWTIEGQKCLSDRVYGYLSADIDQAYSDNERGISHGCVLLGAALTNRPVIKNMKSVIQLSEIPEGGTMDVKELEEKLALASKKLADKEAFEKELMDAAGAEGLEQVMELLKAKKSKEVELEEGMGAAKEEAEYAKKELSEIKEKLKLAEEAAAVANKEKEFTLMLSEGRVCVAQKEAFLKGDMVEFAKNAASMNLSESGHGKTTEGNKDPEEEILKLAESIRKDTPRLSLAEAISKARKENPELVKKIKEKK